MSLQLVNATALEIPLADESVHCCVTSPPYWALRDYGENDQLGDEPTPEEYIENLVAVFREVRRVLRSDGSLWLNLGDTSIGSGGAGGDYNKGGRREGQPKYKNSFKVSKSKRGVDRFGGGNAPASGYLKPKDIAGIPWRVALALQQDGWWLRSDIIWHKPNPMTESVTDRPTRSHEYLFLLSKAAHYFYDAWAIKEPTVDPDDNRKSRQKESNKFFEPTDQINCMRPGSATYETRNKRDVWTIPTAHYPGAHFATYPPELVDPCIRAGTSERGCCPRCGAPQERVFEKEPYQRHDSEYQTIASGRGPGDKSKHAPPRKVIQVGWQPTCKCFGSIEKKRITVEAADGKPIRKTIRIYHAEGEQPAPVPAVVFDPFSGSGTTLLAARSLGRSGVGLDLSFTYLYTQARVRLELDKFNSWSAGNNALLAPSLQMDLPLLRQK